MNHLSNRLAENQLYLPLMTPPLPLLLVLIRCAVYLYILIGTPFHARKIMDSRSLYHQVRKYDFARLQKCPDEDVQVECATDLEGLAEGATGS